MDEELEKLYLQNIEEYIFDEDKIVTYKWLSKTLNVHVNTAKQLLYTFTTEIESNRKPELQLTYLVGGFLHDGKGCRFQVVREDDLPKVKNQFKVVTSEHIYSIHKSKRLSDLSILYGIDSIKDTEDGGSRMQGTIHCKKSVRRLEEQLAELRLQSRAASLCGNNKPILPPVKQKPKVPEPPKESEKPTLFTTISSKPEKEADQTDAPSNGKKTKAPGTIASMFSAQSNKAKKTDSSDQKKSAVSEDAPREKNKSKNTGSITSMFANQASKPKPKAEIKPPEEQITIVKLEPEPEPMKPAAEQKSNPEKHNTKRKHQPKDKPVRKGKEKKIKKSSDECSQPAKKRKRIMVASDSDSSDDDMFGKDDEEEAEEDTREVEPEPEVQCTESDDVEEVIPATPQQDTSKGRKRKRKLVDRTSMGEDGYVSTKKEYVYVSCSGSEGEEDEKENDKEGQKVEEKKVEKKSNDVPNTKTNAKPATGKKSSSPKKKPSPPQKGKQTTLMSFFKKN